MSKAPRAKPRRTSFAEKYIVAAYLKANKKALLAERPPWESVIARILEENPYRGEGVGVRFLPVSTIRDVAKDLKILWVPRTQGTKQATRVSQLEAVMKVLVRELVEMRDKVGITDPLSPELIALYEAAIVEQADSGK